MEDREQEFVQKLIGNLFYVTLLSDKVFILYQVKSLFFIW